MISAPEYIIIGSICEHQLLGFAFSLQQNFSLFLSIYFILFPLSLTLVRESKDSSVFTEVSRVKFPMGLKFYHVFAISAQAIRFSKLPIKPRAKSISFNLLFLYEQSKKKKKSTFFTLNQTERLSSHLIGKQRVLFST